MWGPFADTDRREYPLRFGRTSIMPPPVKEQDYEPLPPPPPPSEAPDEEVEHKEDQPRQVVT